MRRRQVCYFCGLIVLFLAALGAAAVYVLKHEPHFYRDADASAHPERKQLADRFIGKLAQFAVDVKHDKTEWQHRFTAVEINSYVEEFADRQGELEALRKLGISKPRIQFDNDIIRIGFRYGKEGFFSTVVSYELKMWSAPNEPNTVGVEVVGRRIGAFPISGRDLLTELTEQVRKYNIEPTLYRHAGHPVAILRFQADRPRPTVQIRELSIGPEGLTLAGQPIESSTKPAEPVRNETKAES